ncbi:hypothetical protein EV189_3456 [Motilibacter rhizosphaerae]|uniref:Subtilisin inhibitor-like n=1 Tax=Motilibacter rhizosphaerae TaxID=598652 RepID=A0A4Q7NBI2_9ACTN|nr:DUF6636 domain-containing protein [Motilibacter rhizosphaerae]RZS79977.1 hypothetical protein EV189_3456 [Motilibacter rhizosphaerae]
MRNSRSRAAVLVLLAAGVTGAAAPATARAATVPRSFQTPSHNIYCVAAHDRSWGLRCDILAVAHEPARPRSCDLDYGHAYLLATRGRGVRGCAGDTVADPAMPVAAYGSTRHLGPFSCLVTQGGVTCTNGQGHGFSLSKARQRVF